jgi:hypothetical protein
MRKRIAYRDHLIFGESFQRMQHGSWVAQYTLVRQATSASADLKEKMSSAGVVGSPELFFLSGD